MLNLSPGIHKHPNRLFELFVVLVVVAIVISVLMGFLFSAMAQGRNVAMVNQVLEFQRSVDSFFFDTGFFPHKKQDGVVCLGDYELNSCWKDGVSVQEDKNFFKVIVPEYLPSIPAISNRKFGNDGRNYYTGMIYEYSATGKSYAIKYFMSGKDRDCVLSKAVGTNLGSDTLCLIDISI